MTEQERLADITSAQEYAQQVEAGELPPPRGFRSRRTATEPAQVYSIRIPVDRLGQLRQLADRDGIAASAMVRAWVLDRLETETLAGNIVAAHRPYAAVVKLRGGGSVDESVGIIWPDTEPVEVAL